MTRPSIPGALRHDKMRRSGDRRVGKSLLTPLLLAIVCLGFGVDTSQAQIDIALELDKKTFMTHEPVLGTLTMINRSGREIVLDNPPSGGPWLDFSVVDNRSRMVTPIQGMQNPKPYVLPSGAPHKIRVKVNHSYPMGESGPYRIKARVYFPPLRRYFETRMQPINLVDGQSIWGPQVIGVPAGVEGAGSYRAYTLLTFYQGAQKRSIYFRLSDHNTGRVLATYSLGNYMMSRPPQQAVDNRSQLHVLHMGAPTQYFYTIIDPAGQVVEQVIYRSKDGDRPGLVVGPAGEVGVKGGISGEEMEVPYEEREFKRLSERPPGMPIPAARPE